MQASNPHYLWDYDTFSVLDLAWHALAETGQSERGLRH